MRGRKPTPNALKLICGSRRVNPDEPQPDPSIPPCPEHLDDEAAETEFPDRKIGVFLYESSLIAPANGVPVHRNLVLWFCAAAWGSGLMGILDMVQNFRLGTDVAPT